MLEAITRQSLLIFAVDKNSVGIAGHYLTQKRIPWNLGEGKEKGGEIEPTFVVPNSAQTMGIAFGEFNQERVLQLLPVRYGLYSVFLLSKDGDFRDIGYLHAIKPHFLRSYPDLLNNLDGYTFVNGTFYTVLKSYTDDIVAVEKEIKSMAV